MKKRIIRVFLFSCTALYMVGCGTKTNDTASDSKIKTDTAENSNLSMELNEEEVEIDREEVASTDGIADTSVVGATVTQTPASENSDGATEQIIKTASAAAEIDMVSLPEGITGLKAESKPNKELQQLIIDYYEIPKDYYETTRYYYNYVDLNGDDSDEIFVVVMGPYTSGTGGSSALWVVESAGKLHVNQDFTIVNTPVIISDTVTNGVNELIIPYYGGGTESKYSILACKDGYYPIVPDGKMVNSLEGIKGTAIIANDMIKEIEAGIMGLNLLSE